jgi:MFS transporter, DHA2 family, multidrug resistance protein
VSGIAGLAFLWRTLTFERPIVDLRALKLRNFALGCFFSFVTGIGLFATIYLTPLFLGNVRGYSASQIGIAVFSTGLGQMLSIPLYVYLAKRFDLRWLMMFGMFLFAISMWNFMPITSDWGAQQLLIPQMLRGMAQSFAVGPAVNLTLGALAPARLQYASGLFNLMRNLGGAIGIAVCATILNDRTNLHFLRLAEHLNSSNQALTELLQHAAGALSHAGAFRQLRQLALHQAQTESFADVYVIIMACFVIATLMVPLMQKVAAPKAPPTGAH